MSLRRKTPVQRPPRTAPPSTTGNRKRNASENRPTISSSRANYASSMTRANSGSLYTDEYDPGRMSSHVAGGSSWLSTTQNYPPWQDNRAATGSSGGIPVNQITQSRGVLREPWRNPSLSSDVAGTLESRPSSILGEGARPDTSNDLDMHHFMLGEGPPVPTRYWEHTGLGNVMKAKKNDPSIVGNGVRFTLMSYNILAPSLLEKHPELYGSCDPSCLDWDSRLNALLSELEDYDPDILCLQEVESAQFDLTFEPRLHSLGYRGVFKKKTRDKDDGCAIFYKASRFLLLDHLEIEFLQPHVPLLNRDNIGLLVKLETRNVVKRQKLIVGTTHLLFNPKRVDVRLAQAQLLLAELDRFAFCGFDKDGSPNYHPILMTGDFNCKPISSVIKLFVDRQLQYLDENGDLIKLLKRTSFNSLLPPQCGITDHCQHYKIALERYKKWKASGNFNFELDLKTQNTLVNIFPFMESRGQEIYVNDINILTPKDEELISLLSPVTEGVEPVQSVLDTEESKLLEKAAQKIALQMQMKTNKNNAGQNLSTTASTTDKALPDEIDPQVVSEMKRCGLSCEFGSGRLAHSMVFRDIYAPRLDRPVDGGPVSTKQQGWVCVDYIFQSMTYNTQLKKVIEGKLKLIRRLGLFTRNQCKQLGDIPNSTHPSDHFPLVAEFLLR